MSKTVDERVVEMRFDNAQFESNVKTTMSTLDRLKAALKFPSKTDALSSIAEGAKSATSGIGNVNNSVGTLRASFSALQVMGVTALGNITNSAVNAGKRLVNALTLEPIMSGFQEYETQIGAIQTILANTQSKGSTLQDVNRALDQLNTYADKTIYNFTEMTRNIGTFTAAGVDLETAVSSIQGIANLAAVSGSTSAQASVAMYQLSQAIAAGKVQLMDWNSVVNAGMGGELFQNALKRTAEHFGTNVDAMIQKYGSFRESLTRGNWLTTQVLTETLTQLSGAYSEADLIAQGYTEQQAKDIVQLAQTAVDAATKVRTFTQLFDTLGEALQSGWTNSWEIIIGDFNEAQDLLTSISDTLSNAINDSANARNQLLTGGLASGWKQLLNEGINDEQSFIATIKSVANEYGVSVDGMLEDGTTFEQSLKNGWLTTDMLTTSVNRYVEQLSGMSDEQLKNAGYTRDNVNELKNFANQLSTNAELAEEFTKKMQSASGRENIIQGLWNVFSSLGDILGKVREAFQDVFPPLTSDKLYEITEGFRKFTETLMPAPETLDKIGRFAKGLFSAFDLIKRAVTTLLSPIGQLLGSEGFGSLGDLVLDAAASLGDFLTSINESSEATAFFATVSEALTSVVQVLSNVLSGAVGIVRDISASIAEFFSNFAQKTGVGNVITAFLSVITEALDSGMGKISEFIDSAISKIGNFSDAFSFIGNTISDVASNIWNAFKETFGWLKENIGLGDIFNGIMAGTGIISIKQMADLLKQVKSLFSGGILGFIFGIGDDGDEKDGSSPLTEIGEKVTKVLDQLHGALESFTSGIKASTLVAIAAAMLILANAMEKLSSLNEKEMVQGIAGMGAMFTMLNFAFRGITKTLTKFDSGGILKSGIALIAMATAINIFATALTKISDIDPKNLSNGIVALGIALGELVGGLKIIDGVKINLRTSVAILALAEACNILGDALKKFIGMSWDEIGRGLSAMGGALGEVTIAVAALSKVGGGGSILGSAGILITVQSLSDLSDALKKFSEMDWDSIGRGLAAMGGALGELTVSLGVLSAVGGFGSILGGTSILITVQSLSDLSDALKKFSEMDWDSIGRGLAAMGGALAEVAGANLLSGITGLNSLIGSGTLVFTIQGLQQLADALEEFGSMDWESIGRGLASMGSALAEVAGANILSGITGLNSLIGSGTLVLTIQGLQQLADTFSQFGSMDWEIILKGIVGMGGALAEVAGANLLSGITGLNSLIGSGSLILTIQGLNDLANAFKIFGSMEWDSIFRGLSGLGGALAEVAGGSLLAGLSGIAGLVGGGTIALVTQSLGDLADAFKKFGEMDWDSIGRGLAAMGGALGETALGGFLNTLSGFGAGAIATMAEPLGTLADSVQKWANIEVPEGLGGMLGELAGGVGAFNFAGWGADAIAASAEPLGALADSVRKWAGVVVPEGLGDQLKNLAPGIEAFNFAGWGADAIAAVAEPLGNMADSVGKWSSITVPENMQENLEGLAKGVEAFNFSFGFSLDSFVGPLGDMAGAVGKWSNITLPSNMEEMLTGLANGCKAFDFSWGDSMASFVQPISDLGVALQSYNHLAIATDIGESIKSLGEGVKSLAGKDPGEIKGVINAVTGLKDAAMAVQNSDIQGAAQKLTSFADAINNINVSSENFSNLGSEMVTAFASAIEAGIGQVQSAATALAMGALNAFTSAIASGAARSSSAGIAMAQGLASGLKSGTSSVQSAANQILISVNSTILSKGSLFSASGMTLMLRLSSGIRNGAGGVRSAITSALASASSAVRGYYGSFYSSGAYISQGLAAGMRSQLSSIRSAATQMAALAAKATAAKAEINSPSKVFYRLGVFMGQGLVNALDDYGQASYRAGANAGEKAVGGLTKSISSVSSMFNDNLDAQPTIRPVMDLTDVRNGVDYINSALSGNSTFGILGQASRINRALNSNRQNGTTDDVIRELSRLRSDIQQMPVNQYTVNGITYDDGSAISGAVGQLIRTTRLERRI